MSNLLLKILLLIITATPLSAMAESVVLKQDIKDFVQNMPFDFEQISKDSQAYRESVFRERDRICKKSVTASRYRSYIHSH